MTSPAEQETTRTRGRDPRWMRWLGGGLVGGLLGIGASMLASRFLVGGPDDINVGASHAAALIFGAMAMAVGLIVTAMSFSKRIYESENWTAESDADEHERVAPSLRLSGLSMIAMGIEFGALGLPASPERAIPVIAVVLLTLLIQGWASWRIWKASDELQRTAMIEGSALSLAIILLILSLWTPFALYGFLSFNPLAVILTITAASIIPTIWISVRRGLTQ
jgi:hypothetical protein